MKSGYLEVRIRTIKRAER